MEEKERDGAEARERKDVKREMRDSAPGNGEFRVRTSNSALDYVRASNLTMAATNPMLLSSFHPLKKLDTHLRSESLDRRGLSDS